MQTTKAAAQGNWANVPKLEQSVHSILTVLFYRNAAEYEYGFAAIIEP